MKKAVITKQAPAPAGPYSQGIITEQFIFVAGQGPIDPATGKMDESVAGQTRQVMLNIKAILEEAGASMDDVVKVSAFLADLKYFSEFNEVYKEFFHAPFPVRTTVGAQLSNILVEVDVIAKRN